MARRKEGLVEYLMYFNTVGGLVRPQRKNRHIKRLLRELIRESKENTIITHPEQWQLDQFLEAMTWLSAQIDPPEFPLRIPLTRQVARTLDYWLEDNRHHPLSADAHWGEAVQWVTNQWNKRWSRAQILVDE